MEFETLSENYDKLHQKSQEIIHTLQKERDMKILENEELKTQVCIHALEVGVNFIRLFRLQVKLIR